MKMWIIMMRNLKDHSAWKKPLLKVIVKCQIAGGCMKFKNLVMLWNIISCHKSTYSSLCLLSSIIMKLRHAVWPLLSWASSSGVHASCPTRWISHWLLTLKSNNTTILHSNECNINMAHTDAVVCWVIVRQNWNLSITLGGERGSLQARENNFDAWRRMHYVM